MSNDAKNESEVDVRSPHIQIHCHGHANYDKKLVLKIEVDFRTQGNHSTDIPFNEEVQSSGISFVSTGKGLFGYL